MSNLAERVERAISGRNLLRRGESALVAVSGGVDSMVLLDILRALAAKHSWRIAVAHFNHQLRGRSSGADERLVVAAAKRFGLPVVVDRADVRRMARDAGWSIEMAARRARHDFLARTARRLKLGTVVLAHHADDQQELFFLRLLRGSGSEGFAGMKWHGPSPADSRIRLVRPLLGESKAALTEYAREKGIRFREDATNESRDFLRNRIRHELLPLLRRRYQPALDQVIARAIDLAGADNDFINAAAAAWLDGTDRTRFADLPVAVQRRCLQRQLIDRGIASDFELIERLRLRPDQPMTVSPAVLVARDGAGRLQLRKPVRPTATFGEAGRRRTVQLQKRTGTARFDGARIAWHITTPRTRAHPKRRVGREVFDADRVGSQIVIRHWAPGDRFQPIGTSSAAKLQDLFVNRKIPRAERHQVVVATTGEGEVFWVEKLRISERFKVTDATIRRLHWSWMRP